MTAWACAAIVALGLATAAPVRAQTPPVEPGVRLVDGDRVVFGVGGDGRPQVFEKTRVDDTSVHAPQGDPRVETLGTKSVAPNAAKPNTLIATYRDFGARGGTLRVENGFDHPVIYDAAILLRTRDGVKAQRTSICPLTAHGVGEESWVDPMVGVVILAVREPPRGDLSCSNGSGLAVVPVSAPGNVCVGSVPGSALSARLTVDPATGAARATALVWTLQGASPAEGPFVMLDYPMQNGLVGARPAGLQVLAFASLDPPPSSKTADVVILADGVEAARRPWRLFGDQRAMSGAAPAGRRPVGFVGVVPFARTDLNEADPSTAALYARIGAASARRLEARIVGDDGKAISAKVYDLQPSPLNDPQAIAAALAAARSLAAAPGHCTKEAPPFR